MNEYLLYLFVGSKKDDREREIGRELWIYFRADDESAARVEATRAYETERERHKKELGTEVTVHSSLYKKIAYP